MANDQCRLRFLAHWKHNWLQRGHHVVYLNDHALGRGSWITYASSLSPTLVSSASNWWWRHLDTIDNSELSVTRRWSALTATCCCCWCCSISPVCAVYILGLPCQHKHRGNLTGDRGVIVCIFDFSVLLRHLLHQSSPRTRPQQILSFCYAVCDRKTEL